MILLKSLGALSLGLQGRQSPSLGAWMEFLISLQPGLLQKIYSKSSEFLLPIPQKGLVVYLLIPLECPGSSPPTASGKLGVEKGLKC